MASRLPGPWHRFGAGPARQAGMRFLHRTRYPLIQQQHGWRAPPPSRAMLAPTLEAWEYVR
jgi:hypothetical protein